MIDYILTGIIPIALMPIIAIKAKYKPNGNDEFFDLNNTKVMRGIAAIIVVLVHIPLEHQNKLQDIIGSFAFVGVTFFFLTSSYGLKSSSIKNENMMKSFWRRRLPKLLIPNWAINIIFLTLFYILFNAKYTLWDYVKIPSRWVHWLLICYFVFWIAYKFINNQKTKDTLLIFAIIIVSLVFYILSAKGHISSVTWCTEIYGFIWGIILVYKYDDIKKYFSSKWGLKVILLLAVSLFIGVLYLKFKPIVFLGDYLLKILLGFTILMFVISINAKIKIGNKCAIFLGDISYELFLVHGNAIFMVNKFLPNVTSGLFIILTIALSIIFASVVHLICKPILKFISQKQQGALR